MRSSESLTHILTAVAEIRVNPDVLKWARTLRGLSAAEAAERLGVPVAELEAYERGSRRPTLGVLQQMSVKYQINYASLFMPDPLEIDRPPLKDFRTRRAHQARPLSLETRVAIQDVTDNLETFADLRAELPQLFIARQALDSIGRRETPSELAKRQRVKFKVSIKQQQEWRSDAVAREEWRRAVEQRGLFVYFLPIGPECSGFTIGHEGLFAVCVNDRETSNGARIFTLFHEYGHVLRRQTGISDENRANPAERFCNEFAADFLIPFTAVENLLGAPVRKRDFSPKDVAGLADKFHVSLSAMALRLEKAGWASPGLYDRIASIARPRRERDSNRPIKIDPIKTQARRLGARHTRITLDALRRGAINAADAHHLLGVEPAQFTRLWAALK